MINKNNSDFPQYLDFERLRAEGIAYLGKLSGKIWTDHNVHDPGITILEVLCYALLDLGYRTNLPSIDLFTSNPADTAADDNFFSPAQILSCNPLSIIDYRKFLIDIDGVKNAWISVATDQKNFCQAGSGQFLAGTAQNECEQYLNGLYHVYIETEKNIDTDFADPQAANDYLDGLHKKIKQRLMSHRNFCEDFVDVKMLCKLKIGVCAAIALSRDADPESTYTSIVQRLRDFFSPSPQFYTLQQLLDKGKSIDEIFAGRPYHIRESHGFIDTTELLQIRLKKEIHLSDVYQVILGTAGVQSVTDLSLKNCGQAQPVTEADWKFNMPENHVADFSMACSGFQFSKNGIPIVFDTSKYEGLFTLNFAHNGKVRYQSPSPYLDQGIPKGVYHEDLDEYFLLQNDFPRVYGITEGGLAEDAPDHRKAQALQLKAYLLFFDQLLAGYLAQLKNIRALFAMSAPQDKARQRTYFLNKLEDMPELGKLLRFAVGSDQSNNLGTQGSILVRAVAKLELNELIVLNQSREVDPLALDAYKFSSLIDQQIAINELKEDFLLKNFESGFLNEGGNNIYYYLSTSSDDFSLLSKISFSSIPAANLHLSSVSYVGAFEENYRSFIIDENHVSFDLELNIASFKSYLALILEDQQQYEKRRNTFLDHLLARFAEKFTDDTLFSFANHSRQQDSSAIITAKENFLSNYDQLSANRAKGYDYSQNNWNNANISGFENQAKYLAGIENKQLHSLCNFVVAKYDEQYLVELKIAEDPFFTLNEKFDSAAEAEQAAQAVFNALSDPEKLSTRYVSHNRTYSIVLQYNDRQGVSFFRQYATSQQADVVRNKLSGMFSNVPAEDIYISSYTYKVQLSDQQDHVLYSSTLAFPTAAEALQTGMKLAAKINDTKHWLREDQHTGKIGELYFNPGSQDHPSYIDVKAFKINIGNTIVGKPDKFTYDLLDVANSFKCHAVKEFSTSKAARQHGYLVLSLASSALNYGVERSSVDSNFKLNIVHENQVEASCDTEFPTAEDALEMRDQIIAIVRNAEFTLTTAAIPSGWKFNYSLGYDPAADYKFSSTQEYLFHEDALKAAKAFHQAIPTLQLESDKKGLVLAQLKKNSKLPRLNLIADATVEKADEQIAKALAEQKHIAQYANSNKAQAFKTAVRVEDPGDQGKYVYRLVDKDRVLAVYQDQFSTQAAANLGRMKVIKALRQSVSYLQICLGGAILHELPVKGGKAKAYRYQLKAHNYSYKTGAQAGKELVLFESSASFASKELALTAFEDQYFDILKLAMDLDSYGSYISMEDPGVQHEPAVVFIPADTRQELETYQAGTAAQAMQGLIATYPIQRIGYGTEEFNRLFCESLDPMDSDPCKTGKPLKQVYYFASYHTQKDPQRWQSIKYYDSAQAAMQDFNFFMLLLKYSGNLYVDCDTCEKTKGAYRIFIREVLAESTQRFHSEEAAWGKMGLEKFICAVQSESGFHKYQRKEDCCYSFYLNCGPDIFVHPCVYDTAKRRNDVLLSLYEHYKSYTQKGSYSMQAQSGVMILMDEAGNPFAKKQLDKEHQDSCDGLLAMIDDIGNQDNSYVQEKDAIYLKSSTGRIILQSYAKDLSIGAFGETLAAFACFFPIVKTLDQKTGQYHYGIEWKLPGFNTCSDEQYDPCGCDEKPDQPAAACALAWRSSCSFSSCEEAMRVLAYSTFLLGKYENYQPVLDCSCNAFGIAINFNLQEQSVAALLSGSQIAFNPQCYESAQMVCEAVERTIKLSNAEGLHVAEHILLRPHCPDDCGCRAHLYCGEAQRGCNYSWNADRSDPCREEKDICFIPGSDPYSFIATVALPAWPKRFRSASGRLLMEDMLYRLAPAHVLLRILWLAPHDFCCFESKYKNWHRWLSGKQTCMSDFSVCDFLAFLTQRNYEQLQDCETCLPCKTDPTPVIPCFAQDTSVVKKDPNWFLNQVNEAFCWRVRDPYKYEFTNCEPLSILAQDSLIRPAESANSKEKKARQLKPKPEQQPAAGLSTKAVAQFMDQRMESYRNNVGHVAEKLKKNAVVLNVQQFISGQNTTIPQLGDIITAIIGNRKTSGKNNQVLNKHQMESLLEAVVGYALDRLDLKNPDPAELSKLSGVFEKLRKAKIDVTAIYNHWHGAALKKYVPELDIEEIKTLLTGTSKK